jgi:hypothetical protein
LFGCKFVQGFLLLIMKTFQYSIGLMLRGAVAVTVAAFVLAGCASVDLAPDADSPQVRMPGDVSAASAPGARAQVVPSARTMPVAPGGPITQSQPYGAPAANVPAADSHRVTLTTRLDGASEVPPTPSNGTARIDLIFDSDTQLLRWKAEWTGLSSPITGVLFHGPAAPGQQGQPAMIWPGPFGLRYEGRATLTPQQASDLMGGLWYVNISTINYPAGEIRGQLRVVY